MKCATTIVFGDFNDASTSRKRTLTRFLGKIKTVTLYGASLIDKVLSTTTEAKVREGTGKFGSDHLPIHITAPGAPSKCQAE